MGRVVVITGGTSGLGLALKELYEKNGDTVLTFSLDETGDANHYCGSVSHEIKVRQVFNDVYERYGKIDILVNCAGVGMSGITEHIPTEDIYKVTEVNFYGTLYCTRAALPHMGAGSRIINMSSAMALYPVPFRSIYGAVKAAVLNLSMSLRMELAPLGIEVTAVCPGDTKTNFTKNRIKDSNTSDRYGDLLRTATEKSDANEDKRMSCQEVADKIFKAIEGKKLKPFYIIGGKYKFLHFLTRFTSKNMLLKGISKSRGGVLEENAKARMKQEQKQAKAEEKRLKELEKEQEKQLKQAEQNNTDVDINTQADETEVVETANENVVESQDGSVGSENTEVQDEAVVESKPEQEEEKPSSSSSLGGLLNKMTNLKKASEQSDNKTNE
ncbi:MAG: SDR family NAD(P)-dependent oxidoreductase [Clostridia bacterium]|nr:SDR family NAD(P)-dependent oxidoreductase [Clostridia bacterium]